MTDNELISALRMVVREETDDIRRDVAVLKEDVSSLKYRVGSLEKKVSELDEKIDKYLDKYFDFLVRFVERSDKDLISKMEKLKVVVELPVRMEESA